MRKFYLGKSKRTRTLTFENPVFVEGVLPDYDFKTKNLVGKPFPSHPKPTEIPWALGSRLTN
jgi:hypothetical protein